MSLEFNFLVSFRKLMTQLNMLFYYIRPDKESVSDLVTINVKNSLKNKIEVEFGATESRPGATQRLNIGASANQIICISVKDRAFEIIEEANNYEQKLFDQVREFTSSKSRDWWGFDPKNFWSIQTRDSAHA